ncbi:hypothetical protein KJ891_00285, partial [Candidatus Micrarchaeota archaeon]|nr:hypothetical protein [Candidatus Micrarchaeota archaeon]
MGGNTMRIIGKLKAALEKISPAGRKNAGRIKAARNWLGCELGNKPDVLVLYLKSNLRKQYGLSEAETRELIMECLIKHERNAEAMMERLNPLMSKAKYVEAAEKSYMAVPGLMDIRDLSEVLNNIYSAAIRNSEFEQLDSVHRIIEKAGININPMRIKIGELLEALP